MGDVSGKQLQLFVAPGGLYWDLLVEAPGSLHRSSQYSANLCILGTGRASACFFHPSPVSGRLWKEEQRHHPESLGKLPLL